MQKRKAWKPLALALLYWGTLGHAAPPPTPEAQATVVIFNQADPASLALASFYATQRNIPLDHVIALTCPPGETVSRQDYDAAIAGPLRKAFLAKGWWKTEADIDSGQVVTSRIRYVALIRGVPLKIAPVAEYPGDKPLSGPINHNEAAVDSELATLGLGSRQISGFVDNPAFARPGHAANPAAPWLLRVCRLDAATPDTVRRMIRDGLETEKAGLWGFAYVDSRGITEGPFGQGDEWFRQAAGNLFAQGFPCVLDTRPALFPENYPLTRAAVYLGWYSGGVEGVFRSPAVKFAPGAIAFHLHSFSATSLREPLQGWCAPLLEHGAAVTFGNVYEPYLTFTTRPDLLEDQLSGGACFGDAAYGAQPVLSWMSTFVGDPLYRPFAARQAGRKPPVDYAEFGVAAEGALHWGSDPKIGEGWLANRARSLKSGLLWEDLGLLQVQARAPRGAMASWEQARAAYRDEADRLRCLLHEIGLLRSQEKTADALALVRKGLGEPWQAGPVALLRSIELELAPPPSPSPSPAASADGSR
ncbi:MAG: TIGR03790 family protein [Chthoniobacteraceae bacterium]